MDDSGLKLSIVIVNYNVKYFLLQLLQSIYNSHVSFNFEVIIVDNASSDGSRELLPDQFPQVKYIWNQKNVGFNPDTVVQEDTLQLSIDFMDEHTDAGALGCRMIDGSGHFLPESKRGFPSPRVAFFKAFGFGSMFPKSPFFNAYYMGHLPEDEINKVDVLTGAFMLMRMDVLRKTGFLDERFFMYGEDIDLSFRIKQAGYEIYYFPKTSIIHFKGESTNKETFNYIRTFYGAMKNFARKHYSGQKASLLSLTLNLAIYLKN